MAGYCSNLPWNFWLIYAVTKHNDKYGSFLQNSKSEVRKGGDNSKRIEITMGITCHTCHAFAIFALGKQFRDIATCHRTCHGLVTRSVEFVEGPHADILTDGQHTEITHKQMAERADAATESFREQYRELTRRKAREAFVTISPLFAPTIL